MGKWSLHASAFIFDQSSSKLLVIRTGITARASLISGLWFPWPIYMFLKWEGVKFSCQSGICNLWLSLKFKQISLFTLDFLSSGVWDDIYFQSVRDVNKTTSNKGRVCISKLCMHRMANTHDKNYTYGKNICNGRLEFQIYNIHTFN